MAGALKGFGSLELCSKRVCDGFQRNEVNGSQYHEPSKQYHTNNDKWNTNFLNFSPKIAG